MHVTTPQIKTFVLGEFQTNCFVVSLPGESEAWIVDCGFEPGRMLDWIEQEGLKPSAMLLTHAHPDHIAGVDEALSRLGPMPISVHEAETGFCSDPILNLSAVMGMPVSVTEPDQHLRDGDTLTLGGETWRVVHTPGHSPGGVCLYQPEHQLAIVGDTLFAGSIGRHDFPTSDGPTLMRSIHEQLMTLPDDTRALPGHGPETTIGNERASNPFLQG